MHQSADNLIAFRADPIGFLRQMAQAGDIAPFRMGGRDFVLLNHPGLIKEVLVTQQNAFAKGPGLLRTEPLLGHGLLTSDGAAHRAHRRLIQPAFDRTQVVEYAAVMAEEASKTSDGWRDGETVDLHQEMTGLTLRIIGRTLFGMSLACEADKIGDAVTEALFALYAKITSSPARGAEKDHPLDPLILGEEEKDRPPAPNSGGVDQITYERGQQGPSTPTLLPQRREGSKRQSLLSQALPLRSGGKVAKPDRGDFFFLKNLVSRILSDAGNESPLLSLLLESGKLTEQELRDEAMTFLLAGHESVSNALSWTFHLLGTHPGARLKFDAELERALGGDTPNYSDIAKLPYTRAVIAEAMRLFPPAWMVSRKALEPFTLDGQTFAKGTIAVVAQCVTHNDPRFFADPEKFDPNRWKSTDTPRFAYLPFGAGARACIGEQFAWTELILLIATLGQQWRMHAVPNHPIEPLPIVTLRPKFGMPMRLEKMSGG